VVNFIIIDIPNSVTNFVGPKNSVNTHGKTVQAFKRHISHNK